MLLFCSVSCETRRWHHTEVPITGSWGGTWKCFLVLTFTQHGYFYKLPSSLLSWLLSSPSSFLSKMVNDDVGPLLLQLAVCINKLAASFGSKVCCHLRRVDVHQGWEAKVWQASASVPAFYYIETWRTFENPKTRDKCDVKLTLVQFTVA